MDGWLLVLTPLALLLIVGLFRFVGCQFDSGGTPGGGFPGLGSLPYGDTIRNEPDLVSYWRLSDAGCGDGDTVRDEKEANTGRFRRANLEADDSLLSPAAPGTRQCSQPSLLPGSVDDDGASIDVNGGYVSVPFSADLNPEQFSVEAWVRPEWPATETGVFRCIVASRDDPGNAARGYILHAGPEVRFNDDGEMEILDETTRWQAWVSGPGGRWRAVVSKIPVVRGQVTYLCATYDGTTLTLFAANESMDLDAFPDFSKAPYSSNPEKPLYIGMGATERDVPDPGPLYPFEGLIQEVAIYRAALTHATVQKHILAGIGM